MQNGRLTARNMATKVYRNFLLVVGAVDLIHVFIYLIALHRPAVEIGLDCSAFGSSDPRIYRGSDSIPLP